MGTITHRDQRPDATTGTAPGPGHTTAAGPGDLAAALERLGDAASRALPHTGDLRLHVIACQAHHHAATLRAEIRTAGQTPTVDAAPPAGVDAAVRAVRDTLTGPDVPPGVRASVEALLALAEAVPQ